ncbi:hypothetical protein [Niastella sp. OAS944]|uniref:hypothetical protein n=1 Tax=Niastella sp. OAS944 TaxID=2664089 RepID=UPI00347B1D3A|nr:hypothetical protein [Chitinophagaceae bacterium OAS944]
MTEAEKTKIKEEEIYREEIRKNISKKGGFVSFINAPLFLWFLSVVVIGLISFLYNDYVQEQKDNIETIEKINKLDFEIENRISQFWFNLEPYIGKSTSPLNRLITFSNLVNLDTLKTFWKAFKNEPTQNPKLSQEIYEEYKNRSTPSLMFELTALLEHKFGKEISTFYDSKGRLKKTTNSQDSIKIVEIRKVKNAAIFISTNRLFDPVFIKNIHTTKTLIQLDCGMFLESI